MATERGVQGERGSDPGPRSERAVYGFALYLGTYALLGESGALRWCSVCAADRCHGAILREL